jgi:CHAT domain-containing protein/tetratricopeptide (TPR) repeat protein
MSWLRPVVLAFFLVLGSAPAPAQAPELSRLWRETDAFYARGAYAQAIEPARRALALAEESHGADHPSTAYSLLSLARVLREAGRLAEAEPLIVRAAAAYERAHGPEHPMVATALNNLAFLYEKQGRYAEAEPAYRRSLAIREAAEGPEHPAVANLLNNLAALHRAQGRYAEALELFRRALAIRERAYGPEHGEVAQSLNNLAEVLRQQSRFAEAEPLYRRALTIWQKTLGQRHLTVAVSLNNLAELYKDEGRFADAEAVLKQALAIREQALGLEHPDVALSLNNLGALYRAQGRFLEAEPLYRRSLAIRRKAFGPQHPDVARTLNNLGRVYRALRRFDEAEPMFRDAQAIWERTLGPDHPDLGYSLDNLARMFRQQKRLDEAEPLFRRALAIWERAFGAEHPTVARALANLGGLYALQGRFAEAEPPLARALAIDEAVLGPEHPSVAEAAYELARLYHAAGDLDRGLAAARRGAAIMSARLARIEQQRGEAGLSEQRAMRADFASHIALAAAARKSMPGETETLTDEAFRVAQLAAASGTGRTLSRMAARFAAGDGALARLVRERQDALERWRQLDRDLVAAASEPPARRHARREAALRAESAALERRLAAVEARLAQEFPRHAELAAPRPVGVAELRPLLGPDEALVAFLVGEQETYAWVVRPDGAGLVTLPLRQEALDAAVTVLRQALDASRFGRRARPPAFDIALAHRLHQRLLGPLDPLLDGVKHLIVVPDGALQSLPLGVLVVALPAKDGDGAEPRRPVWAAERFAISVLPSASSLLALRTLPPARHAPEPFLGVGQPQLGVADPPAPGRMAEPVHVGALHRLAALPDTGDELRAMARALGAADDRILLQTRATEAGVRAAALDRHRVVAFATHGLVAGDVEGVAEPALVLTPGAAASPDDDGLLTASEIALLELNADWVVLSACNTAAADGTPGAEGLSGLAKAFFHAGSRALLVSHWPVDSEAAVRITTAAFDHLGRRPGSGRAAALRAATVALARGEAGPRFTHPMFWAPFALVGEGGSGR